MSLRSTTADIGLPQFEDGDWSHLEELVGAPLAGELRTKIESAANNYVVARQFSLEGKARRVARGKSKPNGTAKISTPGWRLLHDMDQLVERWKEAYGDAGLKDILIHYDAAPPRGHRTLQGMMGDIQFHRIALRLHLRAGEDADPLVNLVGNLAKIYRSATGKEPTISLPRDGNEISSPFVDLVGEIDAIAPAPARRNGSSSVGAWSQAVRRAMEKYNNGGNLPPPA